MIFRENLSVVRICRYSVRQPRVVEPAEAPRSALEPLHRLLPGGELICRRPGRPGSAAQHTHRVPPPPSAAGPHAPSPRLGQPLRPIAGHDRCGHGGHAGVRSARARGARPGARAPLRAAGCAAAAACRASAGSRGFASAPRRQRTRACPSGRLRTWSGRGTWRGRPPGSIRSRARAGRQLV